MSEWRRGQTALVLLLLASAALTAGLLLGMPPSPSAQKPPASMTPVAVIAPPTIAPASVSLDSSPAASDQPVVPPPSVYEPGTVATRIVVPRLNIDLPIIEGDGVDAPLQAAAHYQGTAWPGGGSNIYIYAHARQKDFQYLWNATVGDRIFLELADTTERIYEVTQIRPDVPWDEMDVLNPTPTEQLTLQTCTGSQPEDPRFLVIAVPVA